MELAAYEGVTALSPLVLNYGRMSIEPEPERKISVAEQAGRLALGAAGAYAAGYLLAAFFWRGVNAHGPALVSMFAFLALAAFILIAESRSRS